MIRTENDRFDISLDMSGPPLFKRGIKTRVAAAPLRENLAFAILNAAGFTGQDVLMDPMSGSGTFAIEGAMIQARIPPGFYRRFAFEPGPGSARRHLPMPGHAWHSSFQMSMPSSPLIRTRKP